MVCRRSRVFLTEPRIAASHDRIQRRLGTRQGPRRVESARNSHWMIACELQDFVDCCLGVHAGIKARSVSFYLVNSPLSSLAR